MKRPPDSRWLDTIFAVGILVAIFLAVWAYWHTR